MVVFNQNRYGRFHFLNCFKVLQHIEFLIKFLISLDKRDLRRCQIILKRCWTLVAEFFQKTKSVTKSQFYCLVSGQLCFVNNRLSMRFFTRWAHFFHIIRFNEVKFLNDLRNDILKVYLFANDSVYNYDDTEKTSKSWKQRQNIKQCIIHVLFFRTQ